MSGIHLIPDVVLIEPSQAPFEIRMHFEPDTKQLTTAVSVRQQIFPLLIRERSGSKNYTEFQFLLHSVPLIFVIGTEGLQHVFRDWTASVEILLTIWLQSLKPQQKLLLHKILVQNRLGEWPLLVQVHVIHEEAQIALAHKSMLTNWLPELHDLYDPQKRWTEHWHITRSALAWKWQTTSVQITYHKLTTVIPLSHH